MGKPTSLNGFVFFTNVDLTPAQKSELAQDAFSKQITHVNIFDFNVLRNYLDQPEGLLARLKYLGIPMTADEQAALLSKYGQQLQNAVVSRFDRVERTLANMERFLDLQKPIWRVDVSFQMKVLPKLDDLIDESVLITITGLQAIDKNLYLFMQLAPMQGNPVKYKVNSTFWICDHPEKLHKSTPAAILNASVIEGYFELSLYSGGVRHSLSHATQLVITARCTPKLQKIIDKIVVDVNGFEIANYSPISVKPIEPIIWANEIPEEIRNSVTVPLLDSQIRDLLFQPLERTSRFQPLVLIKN